MSFAVADLQNTAEILVARKAATFNSLVRCLAQAYCLAESNTPSLPVAAVARLVEANKRLILQRWCNLLQWIRPGSSLVRFAGVFIRR